MLTVNLALDVNQEEQQWINTVVQHLDNDDLEKDAYINWATYYAVTTHFCMLKN